MPRRNESQIEIYCDEAEPEIETFLNDKHDSATELEDLKLGKESVLPESPNTPNFYRTSISSLPASSSSESDHLHTPTRRASRSPLIHSHRPAFQRYSHGLTPRSARSVRIRASPRPRTRERQEEHDRFDQPLVLLHITLLPVSLPWGQHIIEQVIPQEVMQQFHLLREKATSHIMQRGILVEHPESDIDLLKKRLINALELGSSKSADVQCADDDFDDSDVFDSAIGLSDEDDLHMGARKRLDSLYTDTTGTWDIKIFAANGLMRADTWASAWNEMEKVDVEIMPHIPSDIRSQLDIAKRISDASIRRDEMEKKIMDLETQIQHLQLQKESKGSEVVDATHETKPESNRPDMVESQDRIPPAYRSKEIPLSILLRNYIYLLARDRRNIAVFGLSLLVLVLSMQLNTSRSISPCLYEKGLQISHNTTAQGAQHPVSNVVADPVYRMAYTATTESSDASPLIVTAIASSNEEIAQSSVEPEIQWRVDSDGVAEMASD